MNLIERDRKYIWHPFTPQKNMNAPVAITKAKDSYLFDENGNAYIDAISSWWVNIHGHSNEYIAQKIYDQALQLEHIIFAGFTHEPAVKLAERLLKILPGNFSKIFYSDDGSTSTEVAIKMSIQYWWNVRSTVNGQRSTTKNKLLAFKNSYHGDTFGSMSVSDRSVFTLAFHDILLDVIFIDTPDENNISSIKEEIAKHENSIAAFIYEPLVQGAGGIKMYDAVLLDELLYFIQQKNIICIADEVMTGFGRTGKMFASEYMQTKPDIICLSKGITGGVMALGVTTCSEKIYNAYITDDARKTFFHGHSFTANPLACTAANASLDLFEKNNVLAQIENISAQNIAFAAQLKQLNGIKNVRALGTILAFEIAQGDDVYLNNISQVVTAKALEKGVYIRPLGNTVYIMPPYCITNEELEKVYAVLTEIL
ncbi:adenosylmethionine--8-amino-7-oxononanoate transaminase [Parafilimonas terrae]|uniref:Adenosylmethionine-8-amino-7-oxononanoate aminotransferase n=1 Tax=Parafilimonas terrae TaxID=1465490 RepID=A0A1I5XDD1_9BACT|nr:adenosylmethionine--8-amino-7-oxononanoate transaminase [Parafilimonas terrae]SFQ29874.1 adenosylmethionine-8-amino-7-oxononanoate aminotransferase [Parafilimonas terrae]